MDAHGLYKGDFQIMTVDTLTVRTLKTAFPGPDSDFPLPQDYQIPFPEPILSHRLHRIVSSLQRQKHQYT